MFGMNFFPDVPRPFNTQYKCYSVSMLPGNERMELEYGGKIIMPPSALDHLTRLNIVYPMLFKLTNAQAKRTTHCGVLEFVADEGKVYIPYWMMQNLMLEEGGMLQVESASLTVATYAKFQPHSKDFTELSNPKAVLESRLRNFACLSTGDVISIQYNNKAYELGVLETKPGPAVSIIEADVNVDFAPYVGYQEPDRSSAQSSGAESHGGAEADEVPMDVTDLLPEATGFVAFGGSGNRLDGKKKKSNSESSEPPPKPKVEYVRGIPDFEYKIGSLKFIRNSRPKQQPSSSAGSDADGGDDGGPEPPFEPFKGQGQSLRAAKNKG